MTDSPAPTETTTDTIPPESVAADQEQTTGDPVTQASTPPPEPPSSDGRQTRVITFINQKGGVGKTTTTMNLGHALARAGQRVLMVDLDPQAHLTLYNGVDPDTLEKTIYDLLIEDNVTAAETVIELDPNRGILPADVNLAGVESELAERVSSGNAQTILRDKVSAVADQFDYVLIDCPPSLGLLTVNALTLAREVIVPMQAHFLALQGLGKLLETVQLVSEGINPTLKVAGVILCMHEGQTILASEVTADVESFLLESRNTPAPWAQAVVYQPPVRRNIKLAESPSFGQSIFDYAANCPGAIDYAKLAESVIRHGSPAQTASEPASQTAGDVPS
ncbi:ParA family protein [Mucisphaera sp.]|uniref:ParA family protein n=1 Tax=Mucisphaera sp. TaxID=2913024 RepID=UPI003D0FF433